MMKSNMLENFDKYLSRCHCNVNSSYIKPKDTK